MALAHQWAKAFTILFAIGAISGAIIEFELSLLWPTFMKFSGAIIGLPFALEGFAFFLEGIFPGVYLYGARRLSPLVHWLTSVPIVLSGLSPAWFVVSANSWMNTPAGFRIAHGRITGVDDQGLSNARAMDECDLPGFLLRLCHPWDNAGHFAAVAGASPETCTKLA